MAVAVAGRAEAASPRVQDLLARMTLAEKIDVIRGVEEPDATNQGEAGYLKGALRLGVPSLRLADGPPGLLTRTPSIAEVATMGLAATFDTALASDNGVVIADEARRVGVDVVLQPFINIDRDILFSRAYNTFGEDPVLTGAMGAAEIKGVQSRGVMAEAKHFVAYDSEGLNIVVDDQTLHEVYVAPFKDAVDAGVSSIMCSYNKVNGDWACGNPATLKAILRGELGFTGFVTSDWGAVHSNRQLAGGMDLEMPGVLGVDNPLAGVLPSYFDIAPAPQVLPAPRFDMMTKIFVGGMPEEPPVGKPDWERAFPVNTQFANLSEGLKDGAATQARIDEAAGRVLEQMDRFGKLPGSPRPAVSPIQRRAALEAIELRTALEAAVLLKNNDHALPLSADDLTSLAMIGPGARQLIAVGKAGERSLGLLSEQTSPYDALRASAPGGEITLSAADDMDGKPIAANHLSHGGAPGLARTTDDRPAGADAKIDFTVGGAKPLLAGTRHRWGGKIKIDQAGDYWLALQLLGARGSLFVDNQRVSGSESYKGALHGDAVQPNQDSLLPTTDGLDNVRVALPLTAGEHDIAVEVEGDGSNAPEQVRLAWSTPEDRAAVRAKAVEAARHARKAVVFAWSRGAPRFSLPGDQDQLIADVAAANPNTVVVLNISQPIAMPWLDQVKGVLVTWWTGDKGGEATADLLTGRVSPGGRLPFTWGKRLADYPASDPAHPERSAEGVGGVTTYSEGVDVGYRWFERKVIEPLYPFGYGLSYTRFDYSGLSIHPSADHGLDVAFTVRNVGSVAGDDSPQVYLSAPAGGAPGAAFPLKALAGFSRLSLKPGRAQTVSIHLPPRRFEYWSSADHAWRRADGARTLWVGPSSKDLPLSADLKATP